MTIRVSPAVANVGTLVGATITNIVLCNLSTLNIDNAHIYVQFLLVGVDTTTFVSARFIRGVSFARIGGTVTQLDPAVLTLSTDYVDATLVGSAPVLTFSGNDIIGQATNIAGKTVRWTGRLFLYTTDM